MVKGRSKENNKRDDVPESFDTIADAGEFWDEHDSSEYEEIMKEVEFEVDIERRVYLVPVAAQILDALRMKAKSEGLSTETLVNLLLNEHAR